MESVTPASSGSDALFDVTLDFPGRLVIVAGDLDLDTAPLLLEAIKPLIVLPAGDLTIDLAGVTFLDSAGITAFVQISNILLGQGARLLLIKPTVQQRSLFMFLGFASLLVMPTRRASPRHSRGPFAVTRLWSRSDREDTGQSMSGNQIWPPVPPEKPEEPERNTVASNDTILSRLRSLLNRVLRRV